MNTLKVSRARPTLFFRLSGIRLEDFDDLVKKNYPLWQLIRRKTAQGMISGSSTKAGL